MLSPNRRASPRARGVQVQAGRPACGPSAGPRRDVRLVHHVVVDQGEDVQQLQGGAHPDDVGPAAVRAGARPAATQPQ